MQVRTCMPLTPFGSFRALCRAVLILGAFLQPCCADPAARAAVFNVKDFGATGKKADNAKESIQKAIDACAAAGGGTVLFPPGEYSSGTLHLRSHVRLYLESGATLYSIKDKSAFDQDALIFADGAVEHHGRRARDDRWPRRLRMAAERH